MFPSLEALDPIGERPKGITPTGKHSGYQRWMVTEFTRGSSTYYKYHKPSRSSGYVERWYKLVED